MLWKITRVNLKDLKYTQRTFRWTLDQEVYKEDIIKNGYNPRISIIKISNDNRIIDGHHRVYSIVERGDKSVIVIKIRWNFWVTILNSILFFTITSPIWVPLKIFKKIKNGIKENS
jgi:hypothetical protein